MFKCLEGTCHRGNGNMCCCHCSDMDNCPDSCGQNPKVCGCSMSDEPSQALTLFQSNAMLAMQTIADIDRQRKELDVRDKVLRQELQEAMDKYGIKKFENDILKVTYVEPTTRTTIDSARLKKELPAIAEKYTKTTVVKGSVRIEVK